MGIGGDALSTFLDLSLLALQAFEVFHVEDAHRDREEKSFSKAQQRSHSPAII